MTGAMTGADVLIRTLLACGVDVCFTNPGTSEMHMVAALDRNAGMRPVLALLTPLPMGPGIDAFTGRHTPGCVLDRQLAVSFDLRRLPEAPTRIDDDVDLLMVVHPRDLPEQTEAAIDQFVLRGGRLLAFVDPDAESEAGDGPPQVLGVAQQAELEHYQQRKAATRRELRAVQRGLNADIEAIGTRIKLLDIVAMPALVLALALLIALRRHLRRQEAGR